MSIARLWRRVSESGHRRAGGPSSWRAGTGQETRLGGRREEQEEGAGGRSRRRGEAGRNGALTNYELLGILIVF